MLRLYDYGASANCLKIRPVGHRCWCSTVVRHSSHRARCCCISPKARRFCPRAVSSALACSNGSSLEVFGQKLEAGRDALSVLERGLSRRSFLVEDSFTVADLALYCYTHVAYNAGIDMSVYPAIAAWLVRVEAQPGFLDDLEAYPPNAYV
jgi:hypothetical protein